MDNKERVSNQGGENGNEWKVVENAAADFNPEAAQKRADEARAEKAAETEAQEKTQEKKKSEPNFWAIQEGVVEFPVDREPMTADNEKLDLSDSYVIESRSGYRIAADKEAAPVFASNLLRSATSKFDSPKEFATANRLIEKMKGDSEQRTKTEDNYNEAKAKLEEIKQKMESASGEGLEKLKAEKAQQESKMRYWGDRVHFYAIIDSPQYEVVKRRYAEKDAENTVKLLEDTLNTEQEQLAQLKLGGKAEIDGRKFSKKELKNRIKEREKELAYARATLGAARANFAVAQAAIA